MADSVQKWRARWFYIKDQKSFDKQQYGLAPFDASKEVNKVKSWDQLPTRVELEESEQPRGPKICNMTRVLELQSALKKELNGVQLIAYFLQIRVQPLQARIHKMWSYSGTKDDSRISEEDLPTEIFEMQVRSLTKLTKKMVVPACLGKSFTSSNPLPKVCVSVFSYSKECHSLDLCHSHKNSLFLCRTICHSPHFPHF
jgi:hypothetical protein